MKKYEALYMHTIDDLQNIKQIYTQHLEELITYKCRNDIERAKVRDKIMLHRMFIADIENEMSLLQLRYRRLGGNSNEQ